MSSQVHRGQWHATALCVRSDSVTFSSIILHCIILIQYSPEILASVLPQRFQEAPLPPIATVLSAWNTITFKLTDSSNSHTQIHKWLFPLPHSDLKLPTISSKAYIGFPITELRAVSRTNALNQQGFAGRPCPSGRGPQAWNQPLGTPIPSHRPAVGLSPADAPFPRCNLQLPQQLFVPTSRFLRWNLKHIPIHRGWGETEKQADHSGLVGRALNKQGNLRRRLVSEGCRTRSLRLPIRIWSPTEALMGISHV